MAGSLSRAPDGSVLRTRTELNQIKTSCSGCDVCNGRVMEYPLMERTVVGLISRYPFRYSVKSSSRLLCSDRMVSFHPYEGLLKDYDESLVRKCIASLVGKELDSVGDLLYIKGKKHLSFTSGLLKKFKMINDCAK